MITVGRNCTMGHLVARVCIYARMWIEIFSLLKNLFQMVFDCSFCSHLLKYDVNVNCGTWSHDTFEY